MSTPLKRFKIERRLNYGNEHDEASRGALKRVLTPLDWTSIPGQVREADELGYDVLLSSEIPMDPYMALILASQVPSRMTLGTGIAVALSRSPVSTAYTAWELQRLSGGRFMLGIGSQVKAHVTRRFSMPWSERVEAVLDWEMSHIGDPLEDLAWAMHPKWAWKDVSKVWGIADPQILLPAWEQASGTTVDPNGLRWWRLFTHVKSAALWLKAAHAAAHRRTDRVDYITVHWLDTPTEERHMAKLLQEMT